MVLSMDRWVGKIAVVTGASSGIGAAIAQKLVEEGLQVVGLARRKHRMEELAAKLSGKSGKLHPIQADLTQESDILNAFKWIKNHLGPIHILVNNAGIIFRRSLSEGITEEWTKTMQVNVIALCIATREALKVMKENNIQGHIIHINSGAGHQVFNIPGLSVYTASKYGVTALTESLRLELATSQSKIKVTSISPGGVDTEIISEELRQSEQYKQMVATKGILDPEDIADGVLYVLSTPPHVQVHELTIRPVGEKM